MNEAVKSEPSVGELLGSLATTTASLVKQEVRLVTSELSHKSSVAVHAAGMVGLGGAVVHVGVLVLAFAAVFALGTVMPMWLAAVILGAVFTVIGSAVLARGLAKLKHLDLVPRQTLQTLEDDAVWAKEQVR